MIVDVVPKKIGQVKTDLGNRLTMGIPSRSLSCVALCHQYVLHINDCEYGHEKRGWFDFYGVGGREKRKSQQIRNPT